MKESWRFQQCDMPEQTLWQLLLPCRRSARARQELGWAQSGCELWQWWSHRGKQWRLWLPESSNHPKISALPFVLLQRPCSCSVVSSLSWGGCNSAALERLHKLQVMNMFFRTVLQELSLEEIVSCVWGDHGASRILRTGWALWGPHPAASLSANPCLVQPCGSQCPWASLALLGVSEGRCHILSAFDSHCWKLNNSTAEVVKNFIRSRSIPSSFPSWLKATGCIHFSTVWQKD